MIIKFKDFLNEFTSYTGPYATTGFKYSEPSNKFTVSLEVKYDSKNKEIIKNILSKYNIPYEELSVRKNKDFHKLNLTFLSYSRLEANSIISSIINDLMKNNIEFNPYSIVAPMNQIDRSPIGFRK